MKKRKAKKRAARVVRAWAGFVDGKLHAHDVYGPVIVLAVYPTRKDARYGYEDVRRVEIREVRP